MPVLPRDLIDLAEEEGFSRRTLYRTREQLGSQSRNTNSHKNPVNAWELANEDP